MTNTVSTELTHNVKTTLIVDYGKHCQEIELPTYQTSYDKDTLLSIDKDINHPTPIAVEFDSSKSHHRIGLFSCHEVAFMVEELRTSVSNILQASIVNEKQRLALEQIVNKDFDKVKAKVYNR